MRLAPVLLALVALTLGACSKSKEAAQETHVAEPAGPVTAEELNRRAAEDAAAAATAPAESLPQGPGGAPPALPTSDQAAPVAPAAAPAPAAEAAHPPAEHH